MIYTITFNPSLDYIMHVNDFIEGETNRSFKEAMYVGGKGFNVSTILSRLNVPNVALGFVGGFVGQEIERQLKERGLCYDLWYLDEGVSRINVKLKGQCETEVNGSGPYIPQDKIDLLFDKLKLLQPNDQLILAGSIPHDLPNDLYEKIMVLCKDLDVVVDATHDLLLNVLPYQPFLIKPNLGELEGLFHIKIDSYEQLVFCMKQLQSKGARNVLVSLGKDGAILLDENQHLSYCPTLKGQLKNSVGSGDSMIAGFLAGYERNHDYEEALKLGSACGIANAFSEDLASYSDILNIYSKCHVKKLKS